MQGPWLPGAGKFWQYWTIAVCIIVFILVVPLHKETYLTLKGWVENIRRPPLFQEGSRWSEYMQSRRRSKGHMQDAEKQEQADTMEARNQSLYDDEEKDAKEPKSKSRGLDTLSILQQRYSRQRYLTSQGKFTIGCQTE
jgi:hypothetical protein